MSELLMPKLSDTMEEGTILGWLVPDGAVVSRGQPILEIETDKADMTVEAPENGPLRILAAEGSVHPVGAPIAWIGEGAPEPATPSPAAAPAAAPVNLPDAGGTPQETGTAAAPTPAEPPGVPV